MKQGSVLAVVLAGGEGKRLYPLTRHRAKPAVPFGGQYRLIDFVMTNLVHSQLLKILVLTQYQPYSLIRHLSRGWSFATQLGQFCEIVPAGSGEGRGWYLGSADALYQNLERIGRDRPQMVAVFGADHIYRMDVSQMIDEHIESGADVSVSVVPQALSEAHKFGCVCVDESMRIIDFLEKPEMPPVFPRDTTQSLVSMGNYIFNAEVLSEVLRIDHSDEESKHDIGGNLLPRWFRKLHIHAYNFLENRIPGAQPEDAGYWRDVGSLESYWRTSMDLVNVRPAFNMYNLKWPILTAHDEDPPAKFVFADKESQRMGIATDSLVSAGCIISGGHIDRSVLSPRVRINSYSTVSESILFSDVDVGRRCRIRRTIVDRNIRIPSDTVIGYDEEEDRARGITIGTEGIRVVPFGMTFDEKIHVS